ncbi:hypothetical protein Vretifemale_11618 [Volvox reticuliferus]|uniref:Nucleotide-diphospho-sugar transferase domain-containing protein n=1 Tax=Volvox reticuliferus TaxID=1737510 RepID=A0A8J4CPU0_9CHLO|nr:hypothetical protein Vretifemale_11618 [Volvox reticuliferus]
MASKVVDPSAAGAPRHLLQPLPLPPPLLLRLFLFLTPLMSLACGVRGSLPCERSGYCSLGRTMPFMGEVDSALGLRKALAARSYKQEVILMATDSEHVLGAMQAVGNLLRLGLEHVMMLSSSGSDCVRVAAALPSAGCVWLDWELPVLGAERDLVPAAVPLWHNRYRIAARAVRMRYNVFLVDTDVIFFDDPYVYFKSPPFANFTIINQPEVLYDQSDYAIETEPNGGVLYIQNAAPDGPAAWLLAEVVHRILRWIENGFQKSRYQHHIATWCNYMDQDGLRDGLTSVRLGRIFFGFSVRDCRTSDWRVANPERHQEIVNAVLDLLNDEGTVHQDEQVELPPAWGLVAGGRNVTFRYYTMRMPAYSAWDERYGPYLYPLTRGPLSKQWLGQLRGDCECPLWPDPEDPDASLAAKAMPLEHFLLAPPFLMLNWFARGRKGFWHPPLTPGGAPQQVVGHLHYIPGTSPAIGKAVVRMAVGQYDWLLARQMLGPRMYFLHQGTDAVQPGPETQPGGWAPLHLLALHPSLESGLAFTRSWEEYMELLRGLATVAKILQRVPVWPDTPCTAPWIAEAGAEGAASLPLTIRQEFVPYSKSTAGVNLSCMWLPLLTDRCLYGGRGMLALEFEHWRDQMRMLPCIEPDERSTIGRLAAGPGSSMPATNGTTPTARILSLSRDDVARTWSLKRTSDLKVLYLLNPLRLILPKGTEETNKLVEVLSDCKATNHDEIVLDLTDKPYKQPAEPILKFVAATVDVDGIIRAAPSVPGYNMPPLELPPPQEGSQQQNQQQQLSETWSDGTDLVNATAAAAAADAAAAAAAVGAIVAMAAAYVNGTAAWQGSAAASTDFVSSVAVLTSETASTEAQPVAATRTAAQEAAVAIATGTQASEVATSASGQAVATTVAKTITATTTAASDPAAASIRTDVWVAGGSSSMERPHPSPSPAGRSPTSAISHSGTAHEAATHGGSTANGQVNAAAHSGSVPWDISLEAGGWTHRQAVRSADENGGIASGLHGRDPNPHAGFEWGHVGERSNGAGGSGYRGGPRGGFVRPRFRGRAAEAGHQVAGRLRRYRAYGGRVGDAFQGGVGPWAGKGSGDAVGADA